MSRKYKAFTLIELLTVIAVIGVLAAILIPVVSGVRQRAVMIKATSALHEIGKAANLFVAESGGYICPPGGAQDFHPGALNNRLGDSWMRSLTPYISELSKDTAYDKLPEIFTCPRWDDIQAGLGNPNWNENTPWERGYGMNQHFNVFEEHGGGGGDAWMNTDNELVRMHQVRNPSKQFYVAASPSFYRALAPWDLPDYLRMANPELGPERYVKGSNPYLFLDGHVEVLSPDEVLAKFE